MISILSMQNTDNNKSNYKCNLKMREMQKFENLYYLFRELKTYLAFRKFKNFITY